SSSSAVRWSMSAVARPRVRCGLPRRHAMRVHSSGPASEGHGERGSALVLALFFGIVTLGVVIAGALMLRANSSKTLTNFRVHSQATQFARAGLTEAMSWYRRQTNQPVLEFAPRIDM